tara:strand:+ start:409 stop:711 length:303 start_codon:yes stop_codon:yes gene_type:complete
MLKEKIKIAKSSANPNIGTSKSGRKSSGEMRYIRAITGINFKRNGTLLSLKSLQISLIQKGSVLNERKIFKRVYGDIRDINGKILLKNSLIIFNNYAICK